MAKSPNTTDKVQILSDAEMEGKFRDLGMPAVLQQCESRRTNRVIKNPPYSSVIHTRDHKIVYTKDNCLVALVLIYYEPDETERIRYVFFVGTDGITYKLHDS
jgi:hypothetical protein